MHVLHVLRHVAMLIIFLLLIITLSVVAIAAPRKVTVVDHLNYLTGSFLPNTNVTGWDMLEINVTPDHSITSLDELLYTRYAAGYLEGHLTCESINVQWLNFYDDNFGEGSPDPSVVQFIVDNYEYLKAQSTEKKMSSDYWLFVYTELLQLNGMVLGCQDHHISTGHGPVRLDSGATPSHLPLLLEVTDDATLVHVDNASLLLKILLMNAWGDLYTITTKVTLDELLDDSRTMKARRVSYPRKKTVEKDLRCSSFFKMLPDYSDILFGHTTWCSYEAMGPRIFKHLSLPVARNVAALTPEITVRAVWFSSSAALLASLDDFYVSKSADLAIQLVVVETTNDVYAPKLFDLVTPRSALCWMRSILATSLAEDGPQWSELFSTAASGTYNNQWQVLDLTLFTPGSPPPPNTFWLLEEIPGLVAARDMTAMLLEQSYWASYNIPYFDDISTQSGNTASCKLERDGKNASCWASNPRANIFRERQSSVTSYDRLQQLLQYNDWTRDPLSLGDPHYAVSARNDLRPDAADVYPSGGVDCKTSSAVRARATLPQVDLHYGPTWDDQPVFCWSAFEQSVGMVYSHFGQPDCANFNWTSYP